MRTPKHFVNLTGEITNFKMLEFLQNQLETYYGYLRDLCPLTAFIFFRFELYNDDFLESKLRVPLNICLEKKHCVTLRVVYDISSCNFRIYLKMVCKCRIM
jgi:hypothetical protein